MLSVSSLIDFLLSLLHDHEARAEFARDPDGVLARHGLDGVTAEDVRDVAPLLADCSGVRVRDDGGSHHGGQHGPAAEIHRVIEHHHVPEVVVRPVQEITYNEHYHVLNDYRGATIDSYNQDNDFIDNKGGEIDDSAIAGRDLSGANTTTVEDSYNHTANVDGSYNGSGDPVPPSPEPVVADHAPAPLAEFTHTPDDPYQLAPPGAGGEEHTFLVDGGEL